MAEKKLSTRYLQSSGRSSADIDIGDIALDFAESKLYELIKEANVPATLFYLKTKGKNRGYIERQELAVDGNIESKLIEWKPAK